MPWEQLEASALANSKFAEADEEAPPLCPFDNSRLVFIENSFGGKWWCPTCKCISEG